ncbi:MAG: hypothetical protein H3Z52_03650 [archaeon]|nr:hypothetical protein [archaeon]MCP8320025.1 hypothetical protein [archaeon]
MERLINLACSSESVKMARLYIPGKVINNHLFIKAKVIDLTITSTLGVSIRDFPIPVPRELIEKMLRGELIGQPIDLILSFLFMGKAQKGEVTPISEVKHFIIESEGLFLVDTGASSTLINLEALPLSLRYQISREVNWALNRVQVSTAADVVNLPICKIKIRVKGKEISTDKAFIISKGQDNHHLLGMDILTCLGKSITFNLPRQRLCIS